MIKRPVIKTNSKGERFVLFFHEYDDNGVCSNWYKSNFEVDGIKFNCVEQYMMYMKAILFKDYKVAEKVLKETYPKEMKKYGRMVKNYCDGLWNSNRYNVVLKGVINKFSQNSELREWIKSADCDYFVECSPYDSIWGVKLDIKDARCVDTTKWNGKNLLGKCLIDARKDILKI